MVFTIQAASLELLTPLLQKARDDSQNLGLDDVSMILKRFPDGFLVGCLDGTPISMAAVIRPVAKKCFVGLYYVDKEFRHLGYGHQLWDAVMKYVGDSACTLDCKVEQLDWFKQSGFKLAHRNIRYKLRRNDFELIEDLAIKPLDQIDFAQLLDFDSKVVTTERRDFMHKWLQHHYTLVYYDHNYVRGYGTIRQCNDGYQVGPLFAENREIAHKLFVNLIQKADPEAHIFLDVPEINPSALVLMEFLRMQKTSINARMSLNKATIIESSMIYGVATFTLL